MNRILLLSVIARISSIILYLLIPLGSNHQILPKLGIAWSLPSLVASIILYFNTKSRLKFKFRSIPKSVIINQIINELRAGFFLFATNVQIWLIKDTSPMLLGLLGVETKLIGVYSLFEKTTQAFVTISRPYRLLVSKRLSSQFSEIVLDERIKITRIIAKYFKNIFMVALLLSLISLFALWLMNNLLNLNSSPTLALIFSFSLLFSVVNGFWAGPPSKLFSVQSEFFIYHLVASIVFLIAVALQFMRLINISCESLAFGYLLSEITLFTLISTHLRLGTPRLT